MLVRLDHDTDLAGFRREARALLAAGVPPQEVHWSAGAWQDDLFSAQEQPQAQAPGERAAAGRAAYAPAPAGTAPLACEPSAQIVVPASFVTLCESVVLHREPQRFALLYRLLWRLAHEPSLRHDPLDADMLQARRMAKAVSHDLHRMQAFVRFRPVRCPQDDGEPLQVAWYEPDHRVVEAVAPWFSRRFANVRWAILTPERCVEWDGQRLQFRAGASRADAPAADAGERLWLTYYESIFNPARLALATQRREMPRRFWRNLPEAQLIAPLAAQARERTGGMIEAPAQAVRRRLPGRRGED